VLIENHENVVVLRLNNGVTNAINLRLVNDLLRAVEDCLDNEYKGLVLTGNSKFFCIGFDLPVLLEFDRAGLADFYYKFNQMALKLFTLPVPTVCAISGHATAGGTILALTCDYRLAASGKKLIGLNEIKLGVPVPYLADLMLRLIISERAATQLLYSGEFISAADATNTGLVDEVVAQELLEERAIEKSREIATLQRSAFVQIKANRFEDTLFKYQKNHRSKTEHFLNCWFDPDVQKLLMKAADKF
jgi:enoyl-CoA hydratase/carnithine racemase